MGDYSGNRISGAAATDVLNNVNNTIKGAGQLGNGALTLINGAAGVVDATGSNALVVNTGTIAVTNNGLLEATVAGGGGLVLNGTISNGTAGHITAAGGNVYLQSVTIKGGLLGSTGTSAVVENTSATLDGTATAVTNTGVLDIAENSALSVLGTITNSGTIALQGSYYGAHLYARPGDGERRCRDTHRQRSGDARRLSRQLHPGLAGRGHAGEPQQHHLRCRPDRRRQHSQRHQPRHGRCERHQHAVYQHGGRVHQRRAAGIDLRHQ